MSINVTEGRDTTSSSFVEREKDSSPTDSKIRDIIIKGPPNYEDVNNKPFCIIL